MKQDYTALQSFTLNDVPVARGAALSLDPQAARELLRLGRIQPAPACPPAKGSA